MTCTERVMSCKAKTDGPTNFGYLFDHAFVFKISETCTAIFFRDQHSHETQLAHFLEYMHREFLAFIPGHNMRFNMLLCKVTGCVSYLLRQFGDLEIHNVESLFLGTARYKVFEVLTTVSLT